MAKKSTVHLQLSEELSGIDAELDLAMDALSSTNQRIDDFLSEEEAGTEPSASPDALHAAEISSEETTDTAESTQSDE